VGKNKTKSVETNGNSLKLNYPNTFKVGLAFAIIMAFWGAYDFVVPLLLEHAFGMSNTLRGLIMGLDNLLSLFLLPLFGNLSDKGKGKLASKYGRRTPYIVIGTIAAVILMIFVPISAKGQLVDSEKIRTDYEQMLDDDEFMNTTLAMFYDSAADGSNTAYCDLSYLESNKISRDEFLAIRYHNNVKSSGLFEKTYTLDGEEVSKEDIQPLLDDNAKYNKYVASGMNVYISEKVNAEVKTVNIIIYMIILLFTLVAMATFRSPAVALMPDVTPKPLRSQANAVINLCGGVGSGIALVIYTVVLFFDNINNYIIIFATVGAVMLILLALFMWLVKEKKLVKKCEEDCAEYGIEYGDEAPEEAVDVTGLAEDAVTAEVVHTAAIPDVIESSATAEVGSAAEVGAEVKKERIRFKDRTPEEKAKFRSFILILASIFMWFMGYNAVSSSLSVYCTKALNLAASTASIISGVSAAVSAIAFIPVGFLAVKIGRKKSIMLGFAFATVSYILLYFCVKPADNLVPAVLFAVFYLIAGFGLIIANVNTFPMVVELASAKDVGKYTGFYYTATMSAQAIAPFISGLVMDNVSMRTLFLYSACCVVVAIVLMYFVKHGDSKQIPTKKLTKEEKKQIMLDSMGDAD